MISPTWFSIRDNSGNISNIASADYVALAHERNIQVWGLVDNFSVDISTTESAVKNFIQTESDPSADRCRAGSRSGWDQCRL